MKLTTPTRSWRFLTLGCILLVILLPSAGRAQLIDVDFNANSTPGYTQSGAAVLGNAGDLWNGIVWSANQSSNFASLFDSMGITSGISLTFSAPAAFNAASYPQAGLPNGFYGTPYSNLMNDYLVAYPNQPGQFTLSGLQPSQDYQLLVSLHRFRCRWNRTSDQCYGERIDGDSTNECSLKSDVQSIRTGIKLSCIQRKAYSGGPVDG